MQPSAWTSMTDFGALLILCRLYEKCGFARVVKWVDPVWLACAEKGVLGPTRRVLYVKRLSYSAS